MSASELSPPLAAAKLQRRWQRLGSVLLLALLSGASIVFLRMGVIVIPALALVSLRLAVASVAFTAAVLVFRSRLPCGVGVWRDIAVVAVTLTVVPIVAFTLALQFISSAVASILIALVPLLTALMAHFWLPDERLNPGRVAGLVAAFGGVVLLILTGTTGLAPLDTPLDPRGFVLVIVAALAVAVAGVYSRQRLRGVDTLIVTAGQTVLGLAMVLPLALAFSPVELGAITWRGWLAVGWSGLLDSFAGFFLFMTMIQRFGPTLATLPWYVTPIVSAGLGALLLGERITLPLLAGSALILLGVYLASRPARGTADPRAGN
jgi:drug/metabolite transporter (DMT)-like permease